MGGCERGFGWMPPFLLVCCLLLCPFHHPVPITRDKGMPKHHPSPPCRVPLPAPSPRCISPAAFLQLTGKKRRARTHGQPPGRDHRALLPPPAMSLGLGTAGTRSASPPGTVTAAPSACPPASLRGVLRDSSTRLSTPTVLPVARGDHGDVSLGPSPSVPRVPCRRSRLLRQLAGLADGDGHVVGLAVPAPRRLGPLAHLVEAAADAVDVAFVAVVVRAGAEDPVWGRRREKQKRRPWLFRGVPGVET